ARWNMPSGRALAAALLPAGAPAVGHPPPPGVEAALAAAAALAGRGRRGRRGRGPVDPSFPRGPPADGAPQTEHGGGHDDDPGPADGDVLEEGRGADDHQAEDEPDHGELEPPAEVSPERRAHLMGELRVLFEQPPLDLGQDALLVLGQGHMRLRPGSYSGGSASVPG